MSVREEFEKAGFEFDDDGYTIICGEGFLIEEQLLKVYQAGLEAAAEAAEELVYELEIDQWAAMTKKQHSAYACKEAAKAIRKLKE